MSQLSTWQLHCSPLIGYSLRWFAIKFTDELVAMKFDQIHYVLARELSLKYRILRIREKFSLANFIKKILFEKKSWSWNYIMLYAMIQLYSSNKHCYRIILFSFINWIMYVQSYCFFFFFEWKCICINCNKLK